MSVLPPVIVVAAALIDVDGRVLVQQRPADKTMAGLWEFPGGKLEPGESPEDALIRELEEELAIVVGRACFAPATFGTGETADGRSLILLLYIARKWSGVPRALAASALKWCRPGELRALAMPPADVPMIATLETLL